MSVQIAALYLVNLLVTLAAYAGLAVAALTLTPAGVPAIATLQPTAAAAAAMVAMSSHLLLAFLPLLLPVTFLSSHNFPHTNHFLRSKLQKAFLCILQNAASARRCLLVDEDPQCKRNVISSVMQMMTRACGRASGSWSVDRRRYQM